MNYYETLYIVHPAMEAGRLKDIIVGVEDSLKKLGGKSLAVELWGKRKLSYHIDKQKYGTYVLLQYNGKDRCTNDFAVELEHNPNILAYLTTAIESNDVLEIEEDIDTQISGKTREAEKKDPIKREIITIENKPEDKVVESSKSDDSESSDIDNSTNNEAMSSEDNAIIVDDIKTEENVDEKNTENKEE